MKYQNVIFWNVSEMVKDEKTGAYALLRLPQVCETQMTEQGRRMNRSAIGVELRFKIKDQVTFRFLSKEKEGSRVYLYHGDTQGGWEQTYFTITQEIKEITIANNYPKKEVNEINYEKKSSFSSNVFRLVFDASEVQFVDMEGECLPLNEDDFPKIRYLSYGSSITAGSLTYIPQLTYPSLVAKKRGYDLINVGFPGSCRLEEEVADYLSLRNDFDIMTIELGINVIGEWNEKMFKDKVHDFLNKVIKAHPNVTFYVMDIFPYFNEACGTSNEKVDVFRKIVHDEVHSLNVSNVTYIEASSLLKGRFNLAADLVHPDIEGHQEIAANLLKYIN